MRHRIRFTIRELLMLTTIVALVAALIMEHLRHGATVGEMQREAGRQFMRLKGINDRISEDGYAIVGDRFYRVVDRGSRYVPEPSSEAEENIVSTSPHKNP